MPNYVKNQLILSGEQSKINELIDKVESKDSDFDFNKIIKMPKSLNIEAGGRTDKGFADYKKFILDYICYGHNTRPNLLRIPKEAEESYLMIKDAVIDEVWELGRTAFQNQIKYGAPTWYEWCMEHWGTKWPALDAVVAGNIIRFNTAWSRAMPVVEKLAKMFPDITIEYSWADEDMGSNAGMAKFEHGELVDDVHFANGEQGTIDFALALWGDSYFDS